MNLASPAPHLVCGEVSWEYLSACFDAVVNTVAGAAVKNAEHPQLADGLDVTFTCNHRNLACVQIHSASVKAFNQMFAADGAFFDALHKDKAEAYRARVLHALATVTRGQIVQCSRTRNEKNCPFSQNRLQSKSARNFPMSRGDATVNSSSPVAGKQNYKQVGPHESSHRTRLEVDR